MVHNTNSLPVGGSDAWELWNIARGDDAPLPADGQEIQPTLSGEAKLSLLGLRLVTEGDIPQMRFRHRPLQEPADYAAAEA